jgi:D-sedoheptulose 7-phosphate isomerase
VGKTQPAAGAAAHYGAVDRVGTGMPAEYMVIADSYLAELADAASRVDTAALAGVAHAVIDALRSGRSVFVAGNGGSAAAATHMVCDWTNACLLRHVRGARVIGLSDNPSVLTATANDHGFAEVFARQVGLMGEPGDVLVLLSVSGDSANIVRAAEVARQRGMVVVGLFGNEGIAVPLCHAWTQFGARDFGLTEDLHLAVNHIVVRLLNGGEPQRYSRSEIEAYRQQSRGDRWSWT